MIYTGNDILRIERIKDAINNQGEIFLNRVFTKDEIDYCESKNISKYQSYAARFCAKEAVYKALSMKLPKDFDWKDMEIKKYKNGKPYISFNNSLREFVEDSRMCSQDLTLSHEGEYAIANYVCELKD